VWRVINTQPEHDVKTMLFGRQYGKNKYKNKKNAGNAVPVLYAGP